MCNISKPDMDVVGLIPSGNVNLLSVDSKVVEFLLKYWNRHMAELTTYVYIFVLYFWSKLNVVRVSEL